jgi:hypothetical protein
MKILFVSLAALFVISLIALQLSLPSLVSRKIRSEIEENCDSCQVEIKHVQISLLSPGHLTLTGVKLNAGSAAATAYEASFAKIESHIAVAELLHHRLHVESIVVDEPHVRITDGDHHSKKAGENDEQSDKDDKVLFSIESMIARDGEFIYIRNHAQTSAVLNVHKIAFGVGPFGTIPELKKSLTNVDLKAQIEKSGATQLKIATSFFTHPLHLDLAAEITNQNVGDLNPFFEKNAGVTLHGELLKGLSQVHVTDRELTATVRCIYKDFQLHLDKTRERGETMAFLINLGAAIAMNEKNLNKDPEQQTRSTQLSRKPSESLIGFILRGMKEAAIKVTLEKT